MDAGPLPSSHRVAAWRQSGRLAAVQRPVIPIVGELIRLHPGTISLGQGVVSYPPPPQALARAAAVGSDPDDHKYRPVQGIPELLVALEAKLAADNGTVVGSSRRVVVSAGGNMAFMNALLAVADVGDEIVLLAPYYFNHEMAVVMAGCRPVVVATDATHQPRPAVVRAALTERTRAVVTVSPNNPTGAVAKPAILAEISALCREAGVYHVHDEAYEYFTYGDASHVSPASWPGTEEHTISLFSLSKSYGFAGWRIGYMVIPDALFEAVAKVQDTILICPPVVSQWAALGALEAGSTWCREHVRRLATVRDAALDALAELGSRIEIGPADGAFYVFLRIDSKLDPMALVERLIREHGVAVIPGTAFGVHDACTVRLSYGALAPATVAEGVGRFVAGVRAILGG
jgi:aspartate/methionine/tyrosine aminotransferase